MLPVRCCDSLAAEDGTAVSTWIWIVVNKVALKGSKDPWRVPEDLRRSAYVVVDETGIHGRDPGGRNSVPVQRVSSRNGR